MSRFFPLGYFKHVLHSDLTTYSCPKMPADIDPEFYRSSNSNNKAIQDPKDEEKTKENREASYLSNGDLLTASGDDESSPTRVYRRRWLMLFIFVLVFMTNAFQWIQFSIINNLITK